MSETSHGSTPELPDPAATTDSTADSTADTTADTTAGTTDSATTDSAATAEGSLARSSAIMAGGTIVSRMLGFARASLLASAIGIGLAADTFQVANTLPNQFYLLLAGGVLNAVLVPQITKASAHADGGEEFVNRLITLSLALLLGATLVVTAAAPLLVRVFSQGWNSTTLGLATAFALICLPQVFFYGLYTLLGQVLNARGHFAAYMWAPALANVVGIVGIVAFRVAYGDDIAVPGWTAPMVWLLAGSATLGVAAQAVALWLPLRRIGFRYRPVWGFRGVGLRSASRVALWTFAAVAVSQLGFVVTSKVMTRANSLMDQRDTVGAGVAAYGLAFLLFMLPHSLITVSLVTALFTRLSKSAHLGDSRAVVADLGRGLRMPAVLLLPGTVAAIILGPQAVRVAFPGNSHEQALAIAGVMVAMMVGLVPFGWFYLVQRVFYAYEDAKTPFRLQVLVTVVASSVNLLALAAAPERAGVIVGIGQTLSNLAAALVGFALLRRRLGPLRLRPAIRVYVRLAVASALAALPTLGLLWLMDRLGVDGQAWFGAVLELALGGAVYLALVFGIAHAMRVEEVGQLFDPVTRRLRRRPA